MFPFAFLLYLQGGAHPELQREAGGGAEGWGGGVWIETIMLFAPLAGTLRGLQPNAQHPKLQ